MLEEKYFFAFYLKNKIKKSIKSSELTAARFTMVKDLVLRCSILWRSIQIHLLPTDFRSFPTFDSFGTILSPPFSNCFSTRHRMAVQASPPCMTSAHIWLAAHLLCGAPVVPVAPVLCITPNLIKLSRVENDVSKMVRECCKVAWFAAY